MTGQGGLPGLPQVPGGYTGGPVVGPGTATSDSVLYALSNGEHIWTAAEVNAAGGHGSVESMRKAVLAAGRGLAEGGAVWPAKLGPIWTDAMAAALAREQAAAAAASTAGMVANGTNEAIVQAHAAAYGWNTGIEWDDLVNVIMRESGFNNTAQNPTSTAYGMFQFLDSTWAPYGAKTSDPNLQAAYGLQYIKDRYGDPIGAWNQELAVGWYDNGGYLPPGLSLAYNGTGRPEAIPGPGASAQPINVRVFVGDRELTDIVRVEMDNRNARDAVEASAW